MHLVFTICVASLLIFGGCSGWRENITLHGIAFERARIEPDGFVIGWIKSDALVAGRRCRSGWLQLHPNGVPAAFTTAGPIELGKFTIPAATWVFQNPAGIVTVCAFPRDTEVQGHLCRGSGGPKGAQTAFYPNGALKEFFPPRDVRIDGILCGAGAVKGNIQLHPNGRLKGALLGEDFLRDGRTLPRGTRIELDSDGQISRAP